MDDLKIDKKYLYVGAMILIVLVIIAVLVKKSRERKQRERLRQELINHISKGTGGTGNIDMDNSLNSVKIDDDYWDQAVDDAYFIYRSDAPSRDTILWDLETRVVSLLSTRTKIQIATIRQAFLEEFGKEMNAYLKAFMNDKNYSAALRAIKSAN